EVIVQAPEHVIENAKALAKAGDDPKKKRKITRKKAPSGVVNWTDKTYEKLRDSAPEPLTSQFRVSHAMVLGVLSRPGDPLPAITKLLTDNHDAPTERNPHVRRAVEIYRTLRQAGLVEGWPGQDGAATLHLTGEVPDEFALNTPLSPFALAALELLDPEDAHFALDVVSVIEATLEDPRPLVFAQQRAARDEAMAAMKAEGWEYTDRMNALEEVTYPQPLAELLSAALAEYAATNPWVDEYELRPKSVVREMAENAMTFSELISKYQIARSEGVVLRYLSDAYKALRQVVPTAMRTEELEALIEWLGTLVHQIDSSLLAEWEALQSGDGEASVDALRSASAGLPEAAGEEEPEARFGPGPDAPLSANPRRLRTAIRNALFQRVE